MPLFVVNYDHPNEAGWQEHLMPHVEWLQDCLKDGSLLASGPFHDSTIKSAMLIMRAPDLVALGDIIASDPFAIKGLIENMTIQEWDPIFGAFNLHSSMPALPQTD